MHPWEPNRQGPGHTVPCALILLLLRTPLTLIIRGPPMLSKRMKSLLLVSTASPPGSVKPNLPPPPPQVQAIKIGRHAASGAGRHHGHVRRMQG